MNKTDITVLKRGLKRMVIAILTAALSAVSIYGFVVVASLTGYRAVIVFLLAVVAAYWAFVLLYTQGSTRKTNAEEQGDRK